MVKLLIIITFLELLAVLILIIIQSTQIMNTCTPGNIDIVNLIITFLLLLNCIVNLIFCYKIRT